MRSVGIPQNEVGRVPRMRSVGYRMRSVKESVKGENSYRFRLPNCKNGLSLSSSSEYSRWPITMAITRRVGTYDRNITARHISQHISQTVGFCDCSRDCNSMRLRCRFLLTGVGKPTEILEAPGQVLQRARRGARAIASCTLPQIALPLLPHTQMVKFGERLPGLMVRGWEIQYIDYDALKKILDSGTDAAKISTDFYNKLESNIMKVDRWVEGQLRELQNAYKAAHGNKLALEGVKADLDKLRRYVGTNIIAATKIVKKHDKNVKDSSLQA